MVGWRSFAVDFLEIIADQFFSPCMAGSSYYLAAVPPVDCLDQVAVKHAVDDCLAKLVVLAGYPEDVSLSNIKLLLMTAACAVAAYAQLGPHTVRVETFLFSGIVAGC